MSDTPTPSQAAEKAIRKTLPVVAICHREPQLGNADRMVAYLTQTVPEKALLVLLSDAEAQLAEMRAEVERLRKLINSPHTEDWVEASKLEAAYQIERWSAEHDAGKQPEDWFWLLGFLGGKAVAAFRSGNTEKGLHHIVSSSAALLNWHRNVTGENTAMRPGIDAALAADGKDGAR
jgi:hypothetical protein